MNTTTNSGDTRNFYLKTALLLTLLFASSWLLFRQINLFLLKRDFLMPTLEFSLIAVTLMLALSLTYSLILCSNSRYIEYIFAPVVIGAAAFLSGSKANWIGLGLMLLLINVFTVFSVFYVHRIKNIYLKFSPYTMFGYPARSLLTIFGIYAAFTVFFNEKLTLDFNIGESISKVASEPIQNLVNEQIESSLESKISGQVIPPGILPPGVSLDKIPYNQLVESQKGKAEEFIADQVNSFVEPYTSFVKPTIALIVYFLFQFLAMITRLLFALTVYPVFYIAKEVGFLKVEKRQVEKEELSY